MPEPTPSPHQDAGTPEQPHTPRPTAATYLRTALSLRMLGILVLFLAAATVCARLGVWQIDRAQERGALAAKHEREERELIGPVELGDVLLPQRTFSGDLVGKQVRVSGEFERSGQLFVEGRVRDGEVGYLVLTPLRVSDDGSGGGSWAGLSGPPVLPVVRGWVPAPDAELVPPAGVVELAGYLQVSEAVEIGMTGPDTTDSISSAALANRWGGPIYSGYLVQTAESLAAVGGQDAGRISALPRPVIDGGTGLNLQNLFYAIQWWVFGGFAVALWIRLVRDEARGGSADGFEGFEALQPASGDRPRGAGSGVDGSSGAGSSGAQASV